MRAGFAVIASLPAWPSLLAHHPNTMALALQLAAVTSTETFAPMRDETDVDG